MSASKFSDVYRSSFITLDRNLQQTNSTQLYFRQLLPPLNTASGDFFSLSPAQGVDPSIRINKYDADGAFLGYGYLYDTSFNVPGAGPTGPTGPTGPVGPTGLPGSATNTGATGPRGTVSVEGTGYGNLVVYNPAADPSGITAYANSVAVDESGHLLPTTSYTYDLGSAGAHWRDLYLSSGTIYIGPTGTIGADASGNVLVNAQNGQALAIGTTTPAENTLLDVNGRAYFGVSGDAALRIANYEKNMYIQSGLIKGYSGDTFNNTLIFGSIGASRNVMAVDMSNQRVGVNGVPAFPLHVITSNTNSASRQIVTSADASGQFYTYMSAILGPTAYYGSIGARSDTLNAGLDLYINPTPFAGNVGVGYLNGSTLPGSKFNVNGNVTISGGLLPAADSTWDLGSPALKWRSLYLSPGSLYLGPNTKFSSTAGSTMNLQMINGGMQISNGTNAGLVYDSYFNQPPGTTEQSVNILAGSIYASAYTTTIPQNTITKPGNYIINITMTYYSSTRAVQPVLIILTSSQSSINLLGTIPLEFNGGQPITYTTYAILDNNIIDINVVAQDSLLISADITIDALFLSALP